ncbi:MAG: acyl-CoA dehydrogenase family protein [Jannaschia sp.]
MKLTDAQQDLEHEVAAWVAKAVAEIGPPPADEAAAFAREVAWERRVHAAGYAGLHWPVAFGGRGATIVEHYIVMQAFGHAMAPEGANNIGRELVAPILLHAGTEAQKRRFVPAIAAGTDIWCQGFSEPGAGSDLASVATRADPARDGWTISGQKIWTTNAQYSDWCLVLARTDRDAPRHAGLTLFLVPMSAPGVTVRPIRQITGQSSFNEVFFDAVAVGDDLRLGGVNQGWQVANRVLAFERGTTRLYRQARFASELTAVIGLLGTGADAERVGRLVARLHVLRLQNEALVERVAAGEAIGGEASLQKLAWSELHHDMMREALDLGGQAAVTDPAWGWVRKTYLKAQAETIYAGSTEIQLSIIADQVLGLPRAGRSAASA